MHPALLALPLAAVLSPPSLMHPHYPRKVEMSLGFDADAGKVTVSHLTATFDAKGFAEMPAGGTWHLANARLETTRDLVIGGHEIAAGAYRLLARKTEAGGWELVLDPGGGGFSPKTTDEAMALETTFEERQPREEHLRVDLLPSGSKDATALHLEVHFDTYRARALIEVPE